MCEKIIINEFLTFVQNKIDTIDELSIVQICASNFTDAELESGKNLLFDAIGQKAIQRKGEDKNKKNIRDVIKLLKETDPLLQPTFVARNLNRLPPVTFDHIDVSRLLKDMVILKTELQKLRDDSVSKKEMTELRSVISSEILQCRNKCKENQHKLNSQRNNVEIPMTTRPASRRRRNSKNHTEEGRSDRSVGRTTATVSSAAAGGGDPSSRERAHSDSIEALLSPAPTYRDIIQQRAPVQTNMNSTLCSNKDADGFTIVSRGKRPKNVNKRGTALGMSKLLVAEMPCAIYLSRLKKETNVNDIKEYITSMGEECIDVQLLTQKHETNFSSYKVIISKQKIPKFLKDDFWPAGIIFRIFRERAVKN